MMKICSLQPTAVLWDVVDLLNIDEEWSLKDD